MREIKFRAFNTDYIKTNHHTKWVYFGITDLDGEYHVGSGETIDIKTICEYTGLKDKNGKEIYEGDIITDNYKTGEVYYWDGIGAFSWEGGEDWGVIWPNDVEVIGNAYENPELIKEK